MRKYSKHTKTLNPINICTALYCARVFAHSRVPSRRYAEAFFSLRGAAASPAPVGFAFRSGMGASSESSSLAPSPLARFLPSLTRALTDLTHCDTHPRHLALALAELVPRDPLAMGLRDLREEHGQPQRPVDGGHIRIRIRSAGHPGGMGGAPAPLENAAAGRPGWV